MDLIKAFDCLPHQLIVTKLKAYGAFGKSCALIWSYLSGRKLRVHVGSSTSQWLLHRQGGSSTGLGFRFTVLFNLLVSYLYAAINTCDLCNYVDDNTISACCDSKQQVVDTLMTESTTAIKWFEANMIPVVSISSKNYKLSCKYMTVLTLRTLLCAYYILCSCYTNLCTLLHY